MKQWISLLLLGAAFVLLPYHALLQDRVDFSDQRKPDMFISVHSNAHPSSAIRGSMVLYYDSRFPQAKYPASKAMSELTSYSKQLAQLVLRNVVMEAGTIDRGLMESAAYVIRMGSVPSILVETAFLSNAMDAALLSTESFRSKVAVGIAQGVEAYRTAGYTDISGHWAQASIIRLKQKGIIEGEGRNKFAPNRALTRAEFMTILDRVFTFSDAAQEESEGDGEGYIEPVPPAVEPNPEVSADFNDLSPIHWAYATLQNAVSLGYLQGYPDHTLRPNQPITRAEVAVLLDRFVNDETSQPNANAEAANFIDVPANSWSAGAISRLKEAAIVQGINGEEYLPERPITRAEIAVMIDRYLENETHAGHILR